MHIRTLNTIEEVSQPGSIPSIGQFLNFEQSQRRYNEEYNYTDRYQLPQLDPKIREYKDSLKHIGNNSD